jgi:hypothetical protein
MTWKGLDLAEQGEKIGWDRRSGWYTERTWRGLTASCLSVMNALTADGEADSFGMDPAGDGTAVVWARYSRDSRAVSNEIPVNTFELIGVETQVDIKEHPKVLALGPVVVSTVTASKYNLDINSANARDAYIAFTGTITKAALVSGVSQGNALNLFDHLIRDVTHIPLPAWVLRHTKTVSDQYGASANQSFTNAGKLVFYPATGPGSRSALMDAELENAGTPIPATILFRLDDIAPVPARTGYTWGWIKKVPNVRPTALNKWEVVQEWTLDAIDTFIYDSL